MIFRKVRLFKGRYRLHIPKGTVEELGIKEEVFWVEITRQGSSLVLTPRSPPAQDKG